MAFGVNHYDVLCLGLKEIYCDYTNMYIFSLPCFHVELISAALVPATMITVHLDRFALGLCAAFISESENSTDSTKKLRLDPSKLSDDSASESVLATEPRPPHSVSMEAEEVDNEGGGRGKAEENKSDNEEKSVTLVEEIWMEKKPGRPTERVKSNRIYVVEPARAGRLTCQDTRKVSPLSVTGSVILSPLLMPPVGEPFECDRLCNPLPTSHATCR